MTMTMEPRTAPAIRLDGKEKVTGVGRYAADLTLTGPAARPLQVRRDRPRADPAARHVEGEGAAGRASRSSRRRTCPTSATACSSRTGTLFAKDVVRWEGEVVAAVAALTPRDRAARRGPHRDRLRAAAGRARHRGGARPGARSSSTRTGASTRSTSASSAAATRPHDPRIVQGRCRRRDGRRPTSSSRAASSPTGRRRCRSSPARSSPNGTATGCRSGRRRRCRSRPARSCRRRSELPENARPDHRAAPGRRIRRQVRGPLRAAGRSARQGGPPAGEGGLLAPRGVPGARPSPRRHGHRARDRRHEATARSSPGAAG